MNVSKIVKTEYGNVTPNRLWAAWQISHNWRLQQRLPRLTEFASNIGIAVNKLKF